jgi:hypothetical protein
MHPAIRLPIPARAMDTKLVHMDKQLRSTALNRDTVDSDCTNTDVPVLANFGIFLNGMS